MEELEAFRKAVATLGNVSAEELSKYMEEHFGIKITPSFIPLYRASLRDFDNVHQKRQAAQAASVPSTNG